MMETPMRGERAGCALEREKVAFDFFIRLNIRRPSRQWLVSGSSPRISWRYTKARRADAPNNGERRHAQVRHRARHPECRQCHSGRRSRDLAEILQCAE